MIACLGEQNASFVQRLQTVDGHHDVMPNWGMIRRQIAFTLALFLLIADMPGGKLRSRCAAAKAASLKASNSPRQDLDQMLSQAQEYADVHKYGLAERMLVKAMRFASSHQLSDFQVIGWLGEVYEAEKKWTEAERLMETKGRRIWNSQAVDFRVAPILFSRRHYAEAFLVLRKYMANRIENHNSPPGCEDNGRSPTIEQIFAICKLKTLTMTDEQLKNIEEQRELRIERWRSEENEP